MGFKPLGQTIPDCTVCGRKMVRRTNRVSGVQFWGCTEYKAHRQRNRVELNVYWLNAEPEDLVYSWPSYGVNENDMDDLIFDNG